MWNSIKAWVESKGGWSHAIVIVIGAAVGAYYAVPPFAALVTSVYAATPPWAHTVVLAAVGIFMTYFNPNSNKTPGGAA